MHIVMSRSVSVVFRRDNIVFRIFLIPFVRKIRDFVGATCGNGILTIITQLHKKYCFFHFQVDNENRLCLI